MHSDLVSAIKRQNWHRRIGRVQAVRGQSVHCSGPACSIGELCAIFPGVLQPSELADSVDVGLASIVTFPINTLSNPNSATQHVLAEVVSVSDREITLMPYGGSEGFAAGDLVVALGQDSQIEVGDGLLGRVIDGFAQPLDELGSIRHGVSSRTLNLKSGSSNPLNRRPIDTVFETGIRSIDCLLTLGQGQRVGIFAGSGVGKSTLLGMIARQASSDINVIAMIGERGREVKEFIQQQLNTESLKKSVLVVATADQPAASRIRAAYTALTIAEYFRAQGKHVVLTMDSVTRFAMAKREMGLAAGEPPTARGYTPSVFADLPQLCERMGTGKHGAITALLTVLVEGDDFNEPISDALRSILDGHIVLSRDLAQQAHFPAIDVLKSASRLLPVLADTKQKSLVSSSLRLMSLLARNQQVVELGAYEAGSNPELDQALNVRDQLQDWLRQEQGGAARNPAMQALADIVSNAKTGKDMIPSQPSGVATTSPSPSHQVKRK